MSFTATVSGDYRESAPQSDDQPAPTLDTDLLQNIRIIFKINGRTVGDTVDPLFGRRAMSCKRIADLRPHLVVKVKEQSNIINHLEFWPPTHSGLVSNKSGPANVYQSFANCVCLLFCGDQEGFDENSFSL